MRCNYCGTEYIENENVNLALSFKGCLGCGARSFTRPAQLFPAGRPMFTSGSGMIMPIFELGRREPAGYVEDWAWYR